MHIYRQNPHRHNTPSGWLDIKDAPRDGTIIETQNNWGVAPMFGVHRWSAEGQGSWVSASDPNRGVEEGAHLSWRPYQGQSGSYQDPTGGAQNTQNYWLRACGMPSVAGGDTQMS